MDRRAFFTMALLSAGFIALTAGAAEALPILPAHEAAAPDSNVEKAYWVRRRPYWRRRYWHRHWGWRRRWYRRRYWW